VNGAMKRRTIIASIGAVVATMLAKGATNRALANGPTRHRVVKTDFEFLPSVLTVRPGDLVTWVNMDIAPHTATAGDKTWDTGRLNASQEETIEVKAEMAADYFCRFHPMMKGKLRIVAG
jgi:plastocyanin